MSDRHSAPRGGASRSSARRTGVARRLLALLLAAVGLPAVLLADGSGALHGRVVDGHGAALAGVTVEATHPEGGVGSRGAVTGADGAFRIAGLPAARGYTVRFRLPGYGTVVLSDAAVAPGEITRLDVTLSEEGSLRESIQVRAAPQVVALEDTTTQTRFSSEFVDNLPILGRNYQDVLTLAPGVSDVDGDGNANIHGARDTDVITLVDGVSTTDPLTGKVGAQLNIESIQEIEVKSSGASAEFGRAQGGFANILTKSGGNDFEALFKFYWRGSALDGDGAGIDDPSLHAGIGEKDLSELTFNDYLPFLSLSGPIARDRAWYYIALEYISRDEPVNALGAAFVTGVREFRGFAKATWQANPAARLSLTVNHDPQRYLNSGLNGVTLQETGYTEEMGGTNITLRSLGVLGPEVVLEGALGHFESHPSTTPNLGFDNNGNGIVYDDRNSDGFLAPDERDGGDDWDGDGAWDVWEDTLIPNGRIDEMDVPDPILGPLVSKWVSEDADGDGHLTARGACEGARREDRDCDGHLDNVVEDINHNGVLDPDEDIDGDRRLDKGTEDRNGDGLLNDTPFPEIAYPYGLVRPPVADRDYYIDEATGIVSGPYYESWDDERRRDTVRADLGVFVPDFHGSHDLRTGIVLERESFARGLRRNDIVALQPPVAPVCYEEDGCFSGRPESLVYLIPTERSIQAEALGQSGAAYVQDVYKPAPNLSFGLGLRFDREVARAPGYTYFDPAAERAIFDRLTALSGGEIGRNDLITGNRDGFENRGIVNDPLFLSTPSPAQAAAPWSNPLKTQAIRRLTRHRSGLGFTLSGLSGLYPDIFANGEIDPDRLSELGVSVQQPQEIAITNNNLSPRLSVAWDPSGGGRLKTFATWGRYYDKLFLSTVTGEQGPDILARYYLYDADGIDVNYADGLFVPTTNHYVGNLLSKAPPSVHQVDRSLKTPFVDEWTLGFEREIAPEVALAVRAIHRNFRDQLQDVDVNHEVRIDPVTSEYTDVLGVLLIVPPRNSGGTPLEVRLPDGRPDLFINNVFFNQVLRVGNYNTAEYTALEVELRRRLARRWEMQGSYVYSRAQGQAEDFQSRSGNDPSVTESEYGYLDFDQRHIVKVNIGMFLPGDWQAGVASSWSSGLPYSVISRFFSVDSVNYPQFRTRYGYTAAGDNRMVFVPLPRNSERNNAVLDVNLSARKNFVMGRTTAALSLEVFNLLNSDDLHISTYEPDRGAGFDVESARSASGPIELDATRRFGRRWQVGFQIAF